MQARRDLLRSLEASIIGILFVQTVRFLYAALYADVSSADLVRRVADPTRIQNLAGYIEPATVRAEVNAVLLVALTPLIGWIIGRIRWSIPLAVAITVIARYLTLQLPDSSVLAAAVVVAGGLLYMTLIIMRRPRFFPVLLVVGFGVDQVIRAWNSTADPTFDPAWRLSVGSFEFSLASWFFGLAIFALLLTTIATLVEREEERLLPSAKPIGGVLTLWGAFALGGLFFLEFTLLGLPNAAARWAKVDYSLMLPLVFMATVLPLVPEVRAQASNFISMFDGLYRGWLWVLVLVLFLVVGKRFEGLTAGLLLAIAQFLVMLILWWLVKPLEPTPKRRPNPTPFLVLLGLAVFLLLSVGDYFTYDYAFVRPMGVLSELLTGMRGMGLALAIFASILACLPMILERQTIPWRGGRLIETILTLGLIVMITLPSAQAALPAPIRRPLVPDCLRVASLNIHGGYTPFFAPNLENVADTINRSGADIVLLQEVEAGLLRSGSVDQAQWLADELNMRVNFFPQNEALQGLAILSRLDMRTATGAALTSVGAQAGVQYVTYSLDQAGDLHVYNVWLGYRVRERDGQPVPDELQDQNIQVDEVYRLIAANHFNPTRAGTDRVILGGTFNYEEESPLYNRWAETIFTDPFTSLFKESRDTVFLVDGTSARWDYLWLLNLVPSGINIDQRNAASDHRPSVVAVGRETGRGCPN